MKKIKGLLMMTVIIGTTVMATVETANAGCNITLYKKSIDAKTSYTLEGDSISKKVVEKLSSQCNFTIKNMSATQKRAMTISSLQKRLKKLKGQAK